MSDLLRRLAEMGVNPAGISADSRAIEPGGLFLAFQGERVDGRAFIPQALANGAAAVLWDEAGFAWNEAWSVPNLAVTDLRSQVGAIADAYYGHPSQQLWTVGIAGTNGKTSCSHWLAHALSRLGRKAAVVGTLGNGFPPDLSEAVNTTPDPVLLHGMLARYRDAGAQALVMEVSSHGLSQGRINGMHFDVAVFTNLTRDHLDYHGSMEAYAEAKRRLFCLPGLRGAVLNADDAVGRQIAAELDGSDVQVLRYGLQTGEVRGHDLLLGDHGLSMRVETPEGEAWVEAPFLLGGFNAYNLLAVLSALMASGVPLQQAAALLGELRPVSGRMQRMGGGELPLVVVDYAHTPDALEKVLLALREQVVGRLICVFGCGGNRDKGKRPLMGEVASRLADEVVVTSDNPRHEEPVDIVEEIITGMRGNYRIEIDRAAAIDEAISLARGGDVVLIAGKGHEDYQEIRGVKLPFSDTEVAQRVLGGRA